MPKEITGTVYFHSQSGLWRLEFKWKDSAGQCRKKVTYYDSKKECKEKQKEYAKAINLDKDNPVFDSKTFKKVSEYWLENIKSLELKIGAKERINCTFRNNVYPYLGDIDMTDIDYTVVQKMITSLNNKGLSYSTIKKAYEAVSNVFDYYILSERTIGINPCKGVVLPRQKAQDIKVFTKEEADIIEKECYHRYSNGALYYRYGPGIAFLLYSGLRVGEAIALTWDDIDFESRRIMVFKNAVHTKVCEEAGHKYQIVNQSSTKSKSGNRIIPMTQKAYDALIEMKKLTGYQKWVFCTNSQTNILCF